MPKPKAAKKPAASKDIENLNVFFENNAHLPILYGDQDSHLQRIEEMLNVSIVSRGNMVSISGHPRDVKATEDILNNLYEQIDKGTDVTPALVDAAIRMAPPISAKPAKKNKRVEGADGDIFIKTLKKTVTPYSHVQANYMRALFDNDLVFALGPAGTGKTYIAVAMAVYHYLNKNVDRIILSRPAVEAGEKIGFLPGDIKEKIDPFIRPLYDALFDMMPAEKVQQAMENGEIELAPLAYMRGRTFSNAFVILDEAQNTTRTQMKMFLTRMGENSRLVLNGDLSQVDLPKDVKSGLADCIPKVENIEGIEVVRFTDVDVVRHPLAAKIVQAYDAWEEEKRKRMQRHEED
ncbi:MAG: phosphate starvation-inducible protein PhoH [Rickettsiales bacterium]|nr:phosphate starvation-inducible protein PhoH [Rickettsiales bacterium]